MQINFKVVATTDGKIEVHAAPNPESAGLASPWSRFGTFATIDEAAEECGREVAIQFKRTNDDVIAGFNRLLDALDAARTNTDEPGGEEDYQAAREACFAYVDDHPEMLPLARSYGLPISSGELPTTVTPAH